MLGKNPTIQVGADLRQLGNLNYRVGQSPYLIIESCEYVRSFLKFYPQTVALLNIEEDHLDYYKDIDDIKSAFREFVLSVPENGYVIVNSDSKNSMDVAEGLQCKLITVGIENQDADFVARDIKLQKNGNYEFNVSFDGSVFPIKLSVLGYHNIYNALICIATSMVHGIPIEVIQSSLLDFTGASRRFEYVGMVNGAKIYDDYAHHPTEIKATLESALKLNYNKLWVVFQPHTYTRTKALFNEFTKAFDEADTLILTDIYAAREKDDGTISSKMLADEINKRKNNCIYIPAIENVADYLKNNVQENDIVLSIGAGTVTKIGYMIKD